MKNFVAMILRQVFKNKTKLSFVHSFFRTVTRHESVDVMLKTTGYMEEKKKRNLKYKFLFWQVELVFVQSSV